LKELRASSEKEFARKRFYQLNPTDSESIHLTYGSELDYQYENSKALHEAIPAFTCKPLFINNKDEYSLFGQEFFEGQAIDDLYNDCKIEKSEVTKILEKVHSIFQNLEKISSTKSAKTEFNEFYNKLLDYNLFTEFDLYILEKFIIPDIYSWIEDKCSTIRWSQGDLAARNILVNEEKAFKIIDCEFASKTHFHQEDWIRLYKFSSVKKFSKNNFFNKYLPKADELIAYHLLRQISLNIKTGTIKNQTEDTAYDSYSLLKKLHFFDKQKSIFIKGIRLTTNSLIIDNKALNQDNNALDQDNKALDQDNNVLAEANFHIGQKLEHANAKIYRMEKSFSWKCTRILRLLRRKIIDPFFKGKNSPKISPRTSYEDWIRFNKTKNKITHQMVDELNYQPIISIIMPVCDTEELYLKEAIESALNQVYPNFELCIADDASSSSSIKKIIKEFAENDSRVKVLFRNVRGNISRATNSAISMANGEYIGFLDHDDILHPNALFEIVRTLNQNRQIKLIYSDEDKLDKKGKRVSPYFKPDWNLNLFLSQNYLCHFVVINKKISDKFGCFRSICDGAQDWDNLLHIIPNLSENEIFHIPKILYHWRIHQNSTALSVGAKKNVIKASICALNDFCKNNFLEAKINLVQDYYFNLSFNIPTNPPLVSIIIPTRNNFELLSRCVKSIEKFTSYSNYEIIVVDNNSSETNAVQKIKKISPRCLVLEYNKAFNHSAINNFATAKISSDLFLFLNDDTEIENTTWLTEMVSSIQQPSVGIVGCKLLYSNRKVQHGGVIIGIGDFAGHAFRHLDEDADVMGCRLHLKQNYSAVTAACMLIKSDIFREVNGFDEVNLPTSYNDVDLCLRVGEVGYKIVYTPSIVIHHESASRGLPTTKKQNNDEQKALDFMKGKWDEVYKKDPSYNPNLTNIYEDFSYGP
jgi:GT2 family glycosyltransferase